jgi:hypothetical protein
VDGGGIQLLPILILVGFTAVMLLAVIIIGRGRRR